MQWLVVVLIVACQLGIFLCMFQVGRIVERRFAWYKGFESGEAAWKEVRDLAAIHEQYLNERETRLSEHLKSMDELAVALEMQRTEQEARQSALDERHQNQIAWHTMLRDLETRLEKQPDLMKVCYQPNMN